jgi:predicted chitinase
MSLVPQQNAFLADMVQLISYAQQQGFTVSGGELSRTAEQQRIHIQAGRSKTMNSQHLVRLAIDLNFFVTGPDGRLELTYAKESLQVLGDFWEGLSPANSWGGNWNSFKDTPHFERRTGFAPDTIVAMPPTTAHLPAQSPKLNDHSDTRSCHQLLRSAVGSKQRNRKSDVMCVQRLINLAHQAQRISLPEILVEDGSFGQKTHQAISTFQATVMGKPNPDGRIDPGRGTFRALCDAISDGYDAVALGLIMTSAKASQVAAFAQPIAQTMARYHIDTPLRQAHFLAQVGHESGELLYQEELASGAAYEGRKDLGNTKSGDGKKFKGRGLIQLTGRSNYSQYSKARDMGTELLSNPTQVATNPELCVDVAGWFWDSRGLNKYADMDDVRTITRRINGGYNGFDHRKALLARAKLVFAID